MNKPIIIASKNYLSQKYRTTHLYTYMLKNQLLQNLRPIEMLYHIVYLGTSQERRNYGDQAKFILMNYLQQFKKYQMKLNNDQSIALLFCLSNFLIYDESLIENIIQKLNENKMMLNSKSITRLLYCFYKLNLFDHQLFLKRQQDFLNMRLDQIGIQELIQIIQIQSNLYNMSRVSIDELHNLLIKLKESLINQPLINFTPEINYKFCQIMYNIYPEIVTSFNVNESNPFSIYFHDLNQYYVICKLLIDRSIEYHKLKTEFGNEVGFISQKQLEIKQTKFESQISNILLELQLQLKFHQRVLIYDVDFLIKDDIIINCNGPLHFIQSLDKLILGINPNFLMQQRHIQFCNSKVINLNFHEWDKISPHSQQVKYLQNILNNI